MNTFSIKLTAIQADKAKNILAEKGAVFDKVQYSLWRAKTSAFQAVYYTSGKLLIQGKEISGIVDEISHAAGIKPDVPPSSQLNLAYTPNTAADISYAVKKETESKASSICSEEKYIGTDESGKGDFFGPLVIAGVQADESNKQKFINLGIKDSKKLDDKRILQLALQIKANAMHSVVVITPVKYNELYNKFKNLNKLLAWGHARAIENILEKSPCGYALADKFGDESLIQNALMAKGRNIVLNQTVRAEADIAVAAASVLARAEFVKRMQELENRFELHLSKGASPKVIAQAKDFVKKYSFERLNEIAKMHFKTVNEIR